MLGAAIGYIAPAVGGFLKSTFSITLPSLGSIISSGGTKAIASGVTISITGAQALSLVGIGSIIMFAKPSKLSGKETSSNKPSWVNENLIDPNKSAQQNAKNILDSKYGPGNWKKGSTSEFNRIVKWIHRFLRYYRRR